MGASTYTARAGTDFNQTCISILGPATEIFLCQELEEFVQQVQYKAVTKFHSKATRVHFYSYHKLYSRRI